MRPLFWEFFAGGGMARAGLGAGWTCTFANDFDAGKAAVYRTNWAGVEPRVSDIRDLTTSDLPGAADLAWASFPCQDLSLAGNGAGLGGANSGTFFPFWRLMQQLVHEGRGPRMIALENVPGVLTSGGGADFLAIHEKFGKSGYRHGALVVDAAGFLPQSRPRVFMIGVRDDLPLPDELIATGPIGPIHTTTLLNAVAKMTRSARANWHWWNLPAPPPRLSVLADLIETEPTDVRWHDTAETARLLELMTPANIAKIEAAKQTGQVVVGTVYRRTRPDADGRSVQRAEARFDGLAGCLRTGAGGSSRQFLILIEGQRVRSRLISARETARLMGLPDSYQLPANYTRAYHLTGDGVAVPVVRHLARRLFEPVLAVSPEHVPEPDRVSALVG